MKKCLLPILLTVLLVLTPSVSFGAISFDGTSQGSSAAGPAPFSSHSVSQANEIGFVGVYCDQSASAPNGATWNGVAMPVIATNIQVQAGTNELGLYYLLNPPTGITTISASCSGGGSTYAWASSYKGASQVAPEASSTVNNGQSGTTLTTTLTTITANDWTFLMERPGNGGTVSAGTGTTQRGTSAGNGGGIFDSNGPIATPAPTSLIVNNNTTGPWGAVMVAFSSPSSSLTSSPCHIRGHGICH